MSRAAGLAKTGCRLLFAFLLAADSAPADEQSAELAAKAQAILRKHCFECHGNDPAKAKGDGLRILERTLLLERELVTAGKPEKSELLRRVETDDLDERMPPDPQPAMVPADRKILREWILAGAPAFPATAAENAPPTSIAAEIKEVFRTRCLECHGGSKTSAGVKVLDRELLVQKKKISPGQPDASLLYLLVTAEDNSVMPPAGQPRLSQRELAAVRRWISEGAPAFPVDVALPDEKKTDAALEGVVGAEYVLGKILAHVRETPVRDRAYIRYFSTNHLLRRGVTRDELELHRDALAKAVNHLSREPKIVRPQVVDAPTGTIFAVDIRGVGWQKQPFERIEGNKPAGSSSVNLFDLVLLEYPYATIYEDSEILDLLLGEYVIPAGLIRPIPYVRADWFVSVAMQPPLYEDLMQFPLTLDELEKQLGVPSETNVRSGIARRAGMTVSGVSRNNRVVERHPAPGGAYWKSFDFSTSRGRENMFLDPVHLEAAGGEMIFNLPNGLQGYYLANGKGRRVSDAPTSIVTDKFAEDRTVRNGLACMRCHDQGMKTFADDVRKAVEKLPGSPGFSKRNVLDLYAPQEEMDNWIQEDTDRFLNAMSKALGGPQVREPLIPVSQRFLEAPIQLSTAAAELGIAQPSGLESVFRAPQFSGLGLVPLASGGIVRRDMWEDYYDDVVRQLGLGIPLMAFDGLSRPDLDAGGPALDVQLTTNRKNNVFAAGDELAILVKNNTKSEIHMELIGTSIDERRVILVPMTVLKGGQEFRFPEVGSIKVQAGVGKEVVTLFASDKAFPPAELVRGTSIADRVIHRFYEMRREDNGIRMVRLPASLTKKSLVIETR